MDENRKRVGLPDEMLDARTKRLRFLVLRDAAALCRRGGPRPRRRSAARLPPVATSPDHPFPGNEYAPGRTRLRACRTATMWYPSEKPKTGSRHLHPRTQIRQVLMSTSIASMWMFVGPFHYPKSSVPLRSSKPRSCSTFAKNANHREIPGTAVSLHFKRRYRAAN